MLTLEFRGGPETWIIQTPHVTYKYFDTCWRIWTLGEDKKCTGEYWVGTKPDPLPSGVQDYFWFKTVVISTDSGQFLARLPVPDPIARGPITGTFLDLRRPATIAEKVQANSVPQV